MALHDPAEDKKREDKKKKKDGGASLLKAITGSTSLLAKAVKAKEDRKKKLESLFDL